MADKYLYLVENLCIFLVREKETCVCVVLSIISRKIECVFVIMYMHVHCLLFIRMHLLRWFQSYTLFAKHADVFSYPQSHGWRKSCNRNQLLYCCGSKPLHKRGTLFCQTYRKQVKKTPVPNKMWTVFIRQSYFQYKKNQYIKCLNCNKQFK